MSKNDFGIYFAIDKLLKSTDHPLELLTDISIHCNDEVLSVCEKFREKLSNSENKASKVRDTGFIKPCLFSREFNEEINAKDEAPRKRYIEKTREWINE